MDHTSVDTPTPTLDVGSHFWMRVLRPNEARSLK